MRRVFPMVFLVLAMLWGFWVGGDAKKEKKREVATFHFERNDPVSSEKSFAFIVYAKDDAYWCERTLRSIFEQNYEGFRVIFIDDASSDGTSDKVDAFVVGNSQDHRVILIRNEERLGKLLSFCRAIDQLGDHEIAIPLDAKDWLVQDTFLTQLNETYQDPDVWMTFSPSLAYPTYSLQIPALSSFYGNLFKQLDRSDLSHGWQGRLKELASGRCCILTELYSFSNESVGR